MLMPVTRKDRSQRDDRRDAEILVCQIVSDGHTGGTVFGVIYAQSAGKNIAAIPVECPVDGLIAEGIGVCSGVVNRHCWLR